MFLVLWEFEVKPGCVERFESVYGPSGDWARLFKEDPGYLGTELLRDVLRREVFVTIDRWISRACYEKFKSVRGDDYLAMDRDFETLAAAERELGSFEEPECSEQQRMKT